MSDWMKGRDEKFYSQEELLVMDNSELQVHFSDPSALLAAKATLEELGYKPYQSAPLELYIPTDRQDPQSAVEIVQSHGGSAVFASSAEEMDLFQNVSIPAHLVNEDWNEQYARGGSQTLNSTQITSPSEHNHSDDPAYDDAADGFSGSVKA
ncbi:hypothetical protein [Paenibacillus silvae]|uniref:hypothetical protein n=1 Tax=Paenibacillus silvae TaxID=1325358 RepID=UPI0011A15499|nr:MULTISPECIES: hypothetical protein [Paenibacillus]MCK6078059.1 hypothetical protein [Paenibacillus silvae]MCK6152401.1 hypothetical protein [Paenibacillus silvae]MCK6270942.1 hypothetical protein [Paenibacillus silvae]